MSQSQIITLILLPVISSIIGWLTNWVAVKMLLKPLKPVKVLGITFQGLLPRRHSELADRISTAISKEFLTEADIMNLIRAANPEKALRTLLEAKWEDKIGELLDMFPMARMFLSPEKMDEIRDKVLDSFTEESDSIVSGLLHSMSGKFDLREAIRKNILAFDLERLEKIIEDIAQKEFREIEMLGGVLGFIIGIIQAVLVIWVLPQG